MFDSWLVDVFVTNPFKCMESKMNLHAAKQVQEPFPNACSSKTIAMTTIETDGIFHTTSSAAPEEEVNRIVFLSLSILTTSKKSCFVFRVILRTVCVPNRRSSHYSWSDISFVFSANVSSVLHCSALPSSDALWMDILSQVKGGHTLQQMCHGLLLCLWTGKWSRFSHTWLSNSRLGIWVL